MRPSRLDGTFGAMERFEEQVKKMFAQRLKTARMKAGFRFAGEFATALRVEEHTYRSWERGAHLPDIPTTTRICKLLNIEPNDLMPLAKRSGSPPPDNSDDKKVA